VSTTTSHLLLHPLIQQTRFVRRLPRRYLGALVLVVLLALVAQAVIQIFPSQLAASDHVISLAANQETLSQRVSKDALDLAFINDPVSRAFSLTEFTTAARTWNRVHLGLQHGDAGLSLPRNSDQVIAQDFHALDPQYQAMLHTTLDVLRFIDTYKLSHPDAPLGFDGAALLPDVQALLAAEAPFAQGMEGIVVRLEQLEVEQVAQVRLVEIGLCAVLLLVLLLEALFIFLPALHTLKDNLRQLERADRRLRDYATELGRQTKQLEEAFEEAWQTGSRTLLPVRMVGSGHYLVSSRVRDRPYQVKRGPSGTGLVCECNINALGYICTHILSASHFQAAWQRTQVRAQTDSRDQEEPRGQPGLPHRTHLLSAPSAAYRGPMIRS